MIKSMTGFGRYELADENRKFTVELKSVNHRYLDCNVRIPKKLSFFESAIRVLLKEYSSRGKVDIYVTYENLTQGQSELKYNAQLAKAYVEYMNEMNRTLGINSDVNAAQLARFPEVLSFEESEEDNDAIWETLSKTCKEAFANFRESRMVEGASLEVDIMDKLKNMEECITKVEEHSPEILREYRERIHEKVRELLDDAQIDENRIATEIVLFSDKICTDEEVVRLRSHISHMRETMKAKDGIGRKLDFIAQEMNREANTILSKANDITISNIAIELKTEVEKIREQIQNIE